MRFVNRPAEPPEALSALEFARMRSDYLDFLGLDRAKRRQTRPPDRHLPKSPALKAALDALFLGKCAFCEQSIPTRPYRFRPTSKVDYDMLRAEDGYGKAWAPEFLHYGWLADSWDNLYVICDGCLPTRQSFFPIVGQRQAIPTHATYESYARRNTGRWDGTDGLTDPDLENPLLIDPCKDRISDHLGAAMSGDLVPRSQKGNMTLRHFQLNRPGLKEARAASARELMRRFERAPPDPALEVDQLLHDTLEFAGFLRLLVEDWRAGRRLPFQPNVLGLTDLHVSLSLPDTHAAASFPLLRRVSISGFKAIEDLSFDMPERAAPEDPVPGLLILGENAAGKSSILEAMALALSAPEAGGVLVTDPKKLLLDPTQMGQDSRRRQKAKVVLEFADGSSRRLALTAKGLQHEGEVAFPVFAYGAYRHFVDDHRDWAPERGVVSLFRSDNLLSNPEKWLTTLEDTLFDQVIAALRSIFGSAAAFHHMERDPAKGCIVVTEPDGPQGPKMRTPLAAVSSGFRTVLALSCDVMRWLTNPALGWDVLDLELAQGIVLIDEIEAHLHPRWKIEIMDGLRRALPQVTFIVTTHDPLCLRGMRNGEVMVLRRVPQSGAGRLPVKIEQLDRLPDMTNLTIEQLLKSDFFALFDTDDPQRGRSMAQLADALTRGDNPALVEQFRDEVTHALPLGRSEVSMLVQEAVADYIREQGRLLQDERGKLRDGTRRRILAILQTGRDDAAG